MESYVRNEVTLAVSKLRIGIKIKWHYKFYEYDLITTKNYMYLKFQPFQEYVTNFVQTILSQYLIPIPSWKRQKISGFPTFSGDIKM